MLLRQATNRFAWTRAMTFSGARFRWRFLHLGEGLRGRVLARAQVDGRFFECKSSGRREVAVQQFRAMLLRQATNRIAWTGALEYSGANLWQSNGTLSGAGYGKRPYTRSERRTRATAPLAPFEHGRGGFWGVSCSV
jgi:hypothetical protein